MDQAPVMSNPKELYRQLCAAEKNIPVFLKDWWLDASCGPEHWDVVLCVENGNIIGAMPFWRKRKAGFVHSTMPLLTSNWGPWIASVRDKSPSSQLHHEHHVMAQLIEQLPPFDYFNQRFRYTVSNGLPFYWKGYSLQTRYTYVIENLTDLQAVYNGFNTNIKRQIKKAEKIVRVVETNDIEKFYRLNTKTFQRQGLKPPYPLSYVARLDEACHANNSRKIFLAIDEKGEEHGALYLVWDDLSAYYLMGGTDTTFSSGAFSLLMWEAIKTAAVITQRFDFEGSMIESIERFFRSFGAQQKPYLQVTKTSSAVLRTAICLRGIFS